MLLIKVTSDLDIFNNRVIRMEIKSEYDKKKNELLRGMGFNFDRYIKAHTKMITDKLEAKKLINHLSKINKDYTLEYVKVIKRKRSLGLNKMIDSVKSSRIKKDINFF